jgi:PAS domain S-box-containing protein
MTSALPSERVGPARADEQTLLSRLAVAEDTLSALGRGQVDAIVVQTDQGERIYTLEGADRIYRVLVDTMAEGAATVAADGTILYGNAQLGEILGVSLEQVAGGRLTQYMSDAHAAAFAAAVANTGQEPSRLEVHLRRANGAAVPVGLALRRLASSAGSFSVVVSDLTLTRQREHVERLGESLAIAISTAEDLVGGLQATLAIIRTHQSWAQASAWLPAGAPGEWTRAAVDPASGPNELLTPSQLEEDALARASRSHELEIAVDDEPPTPIGAPAVVAALPITAGGDIVCIVTVFARVSLQPGNSPEAEILSRASVHLGDLLERKRAEDELRRFSAQLERRVHDRTRELETANQELEAFAYSVSHDLRAPLRAIDGFASILASQYQAELDATGCDLLDRVQAAAGRMSILIDALLGLSKLTGIEMKLEHVDLGEIAAQIERELRAGDPAREVEFVIADALWALADRELATVALQNLLQNAWKFTAVTNHPRIELASTGPHAFVVRDNGAGFDSAYAHKLFVPFERLHAAQEFTGTGIGLATVARVMHRHGGTVRAEGKVGEGAAFYFEFGCPGDSAQAHETGYASQIR